MDLVLEISLKDVTMKLLSFILCLLPVSLAAPAVRAVAPTVTIAYPQATLIGVAGDVETFNGVPFAQAPVGSLRLKPPQALTAPLGTVDATSNGQACPQFFFSTYVNDAIPTSVLGLLLDTPLFQTILDAGEDCLMLNIHRPAGTTANASLPVLFWIFGGGFELGWNAMYDGAAWVTPSIAAGKPIIVVTVNYRVGGFGFLPGKEVLADGSANLGLLDQRLGLQWVADNIADFGGDPDKVTIWGESAGAISVLDQMVLYDGNYTYKDKPLFRAGIMNSGSIVPANPVDSAKGQTVYDTVVAAAGCSSANDTLECLREVPYETLLNATNSVSGILSYTSVALNYIPRPDGTVLTGSPEVLVEAGKYAPVPFIVGDQEDEGTIFALFQSNITTIDQLVTYLQTIFFNDATTAQIQDLVATYPDITTDGSPFRTLDLNNWYPQYKRLAAILGDLTFTLARRVLLNLTSSVNPTVPSWSYLSSYDYGTAILGTFHASDILQVFFGIVPDYASEATYAYYLSFIYELDPNENTTGYPNWPQWAGSQELMNFYATDGVTTADDFRNDTYDFLTANIASLYI
ncbi:putative secreted lipase [Lachnellula arida]|uniref:Carboxylic ester hydrolase n=1 Tax=Lachnellula arida TaxID=1316785 RepID=A0A8T9BPB7_9HELO|nr:putative secreted lipase [Lachnellula arida]